MQLLPGICVHKDTFPGLIITMDLWSLFHYSSVFLAGDGSCYLFSTEDASNGLVKCTGSNLDAINCVKAQGNVIYTICKDGVIRIYNLQHIV